MGTAREKLSQIEEASKNDSPIQKQAKYPSNLYRVYIALMTSRF
jgi:hypothetical protein